MWDVDGAAETSSLKLKQDLWILSSPELLSTCFPFAVLSLSTPQKSVQKKSRSRYHSLWDLMVHGRVRSLKSDPVELCRHQPAAPSSWPWLITTSWLTHHVRRLTQAAVHSWLTLQGISPPCPCLLAALVLCTLRKARNCHINRFDASVRVSLAS